MKIDATSAQPKFRRAKGVAKRFIRVRALVFLLVALVACSRSDVTPPKSAPERFDYSLSVDISAQASRAEVEARYGGQVVVWRPEAGFAVLGLHSTGELRTLGAKENKDAFEVPEYAAQGFDGGGRTSWSGGRTSWSGGRTSWSGGGTSANGGEPTTFSENVAYWDQVDLPEAQALAPHLGAGVKVAVIDTGIDLVHPAFSGKLAPPHEWRDFVDDDSYPQEVEGWNYGHGTGVADLILQVAPNVTLLPIRALGPDGLGDTTDVLVAVDYAVQSGADIINLSLGTDTEEEVLRNLIKYAREREVIIVASAGNGGGETITFPAKYGKDGKEVLSVGSVNAYDELSSFSAHGEELSLAAPGEFLYTASPEQSVAFWSGTSFSTPVVSGAAALALGEYHLKEDPEVIGEKLASASYDLEDIGRNGFYEDGQLGKGRLDIEGFLEDVLDL